MSKRMLVACAAALVALAVPGSAHAVDADYFESAASGQAFYEQMSIHSSSLRVTDTVYVAYQGRSLDPYVVGLRDDGAVIGPYRAGDNPLDTTADPDDTHGAPALLHDPERGVFHVFFGSHATAMRHAVSAPGTIARWSTVSPLPGRTTYPQAFRTTDGATWLFYRLAASVVATSGGGGGLCAPGWYWSRSPDGGRTWTAPTPALLETGGERWYAHVEPSPDGSVWIAAVTSVRAMALPTARRGLVVARMDRGEGVWETAHGSRLVSATAGIPGALALAEAAVPADPGEWRNGTTIAFTQSGEPRILTAVGLQWGPDACRWEVARPEGSTWATAPLATTDFLMDAGVITATGGDTFEAVVTAGEGVCGPPRDPASRRGGDLVRLRSTDAGRTWATVEVLARADRSRGVVYSNPQVVTGSGPGTPTVVWGEWDNDGGECTSKLHLWGPGGRFTRRLATRTTRLAGADRYAGAAAMSRWSFPSGSDTAIVVSGAAGADAAAAVPLAAAYRAPVLYARPTGVPIATALELKRLRARRVIVVGGTGSVGARAAAALRVAEVDTVRRIGGADRFEVAAGIARELASVCGTAPVAFVTSGLAVTDALVAAPAAASRYAPVLYTTPAGLPAATEQALRALAPSATVLVALDGSLPATAALVLPEPEQVRAPHAPALSVAVARLGLDGSPASPPALRPTRVYLASAAAPADALPGALLAARGRGPLVLTDGATLSPDAEALIAELAPSVAECVVLGGTATLRPAVVDRLALTWR